MSERRMAYLRGPARAVLVHEVVGDCPGAIEADALAVYEGVLGECTDVPAMDDGVFAMAAVYPVLHAATMAHMCRRVVRERHEYLAAQTDLLKEFCQAYPWVGEEYARAATIDPAVVETCLFCTDPAQFVRDILFEEWRRMACVEMVRARNPCIG